MAAIDGRFADVVQTIYGGAGRANGWPDILATVADVTGAASGCIVASRADTAHASVNCAANIDPAWIEAYNNHFWQFDPSPALMASHAGEVLVDHVTGARPADTTGACRTFYNEVMRPQGFRHTLILGFGGGRDWDAGIILQRTARQGPFPAAEAATLGSLSGHLDQALDLHARLIEAGALDSGMAAALDRAPVGVVFLDASGATVRTNRRAEEIFAHSSALSVSRGTFVAHRARDNAKLQRLIGAAIASALGRQDTGGGALHAHGREPGSAVHVDVRPVAAISGNDPLAGLRALVAVWLSPLDATPSPSPASFRALYGLTPAEGDLLASLVEGRTLAQTADLRGVSRETVRTQLKGVMTKVGVSRQADLLRTVLGGAGMGWSGGGDRDGVDRDGDVTGGEATERADPDAGSMS